MPRKTTADPADDAVALLDAPATPQTIDQVLADADEMTAREDCERRKADDNWWNHYIRILREPEAAHPDAAQVLADGLQTGRITREQIAADRKLVAEAVKKVAHCDAFAKNGPALLQRSSAAREALLRQKREYEAERLRLRKEAERYSSEHATVQGYTHDVVCLARQRPELFGPNRIELPGDLASTVYPPYRNGADDYHRREYERLAG